MLTVAQARLAGPLQPTGRFPKVPDMPKPVIALPSLEVNEMLMVRAAPTSTDTVPATEEVATTTSLLPEGRLGGAMGLPGGPLLVVTGVLPALSSVPRLLPDELDPQPDSSSNEQIPARNDKRLVACMAFEQWSG
jgi:hypothetical protein